MRFKVGDKIKWNTSHTIFTVSEISGPRFRVEGYHVWNYDAPGVALVEEEKPKITPHKWAKEIKAWADGAVIEVSRPTRTNKWTEWVSLKDPQWWEGHRYRIKPEKKPDVVKFMSVWTTNPGVYASKESPVRQEVGGELKLTFDGETGKLKAVEILS